MIAKTDGLHREPLQTLEVDERIQTSTDIATMLKRHAPPGREHAWNMMVEGLLALLKGEKE